MPRRVTVQINAVVWLLLSASPWAGTDRLDASPLVPVSSDAPGSAALPSVGPAPAHVFARGDWETPFAAGNNFRSTISPMVERSGVGQLPPDPEVSSRHRGQLPPPGPVPAQALLPPLLGPPVAPRSVGTPGDVSVATQPTSVATQITPPSSVHSEEVARPVSSSLDETAQAAPTVRSAALGRPTASAELVPAQALEHRETSASAPPRSDPVQTFLQQRSTLGETPVQSASSSADNPPPANTTRFGERLGDILHHALGNTQELFKSDHVFDNFISPMTNPFLLEDPRSLTEFRPLFIFQKVPRSQPDFRGGDIWFFGGQARVALTDRISLVIHKLGGLSINTGNASIYDGSTGFSELWLGPKYTLIRNEQSGSVLAAGLQFQIPLGTRSVYQDTGSLSLAPYLSYAQNLDFGWRVGSLNALVGTGYSFSVTAERSDYYYLSAQVDLDTFNNHRFYPLMGLNWQVVTANGKERPFFGAEGRDLFNLGGLARGRGLMTWAVGARYKINEAAQLGAAFELPIAGPRDFFSYRFTVDFILRY